MSQGRSTESLNALQITTVPTGNTDAVGSKTIGAQDMELAEMKRRATGQSMIGEAFGARDGRIIGGEDGGSVSG